MILLAILVAGCTSAGENETATPAPTVPAWAQATLVAAEGVRRSVGGPIAVDPRPVSILAAPQVPDDADYHSDRSEEELVQLLEQAGFAITRALPIREGCTGLLAPPSHRQHQGCPDERELEAIFDLVQEREGQPTVMAALIGYQPNGRFITVMRIWLRETDAGYEFDRDEVLLTLD
ncbi:MAG TPA: hypothetical protein VK966_13220 [Longimicrobiales bacterium]|nr:hypothetical protein [Longimicrobiales bacterium]